jgi:Carboxypeptidase regulatory-like domain
MSPFNSHWGASGWLWRSSCCFAVAALTVPSTLASQVVVGQVVDAPTAGPVGEGFVVLLDEEGREVARTLTAADARFVLRAPRSGRYRLRSERIGYVAFVAPAFTLEQNQTLTQRLPVTALPVQLAAVEITARTPCRMSPDRAEATAAVWGEIRKALAAAVWTARQPAYRYRAVGYRRVWDAARSRAVVETRDTLVGHWWAPWASRPAAELAELGYIRSEADSTAYYGPDARVIQDSTFLGSHCFALSRRSLDGEEQVGLTFVPEPRRTLPDVRGALWLDQRSAELRVLEYSYTRVPEGVEDERVGGTIEFLRLPSGAWIVRRWQIRMPRLGLDMFRAPDGHLERRVRVLGFHDAGGEVLEVRALDGKIVYPP